MESHAFSHPQPYTKAPTYMDASQYSYQNPGSFQSVNGKMYFFPAIVQTPPEFNKAQGSPYPIDWKFENEAKREQFYPQKPQTMMSGAQMYHATGFTNTAPSGKPDFIEAIPPSTLGDLSVHFTDPRLNQETTIQYDHVTTREGEEAPTYPVDFKGYIPGQAGYQGKGTMNMEHAPNAYATQMTAMSHYGPPPNQYTMAPQPTYAMAPQTTYAMPPPTTYTMPPTTFNQSHFMTSVNHMNNPMQKFPSIQTSAFASQYMPSIPNVVQHEREVVHYVPRIETKVVEREVYVPGDQKIFVPQPFNADTYVIVPKYEDVEVKFVVSEAVVPEIHESEDVIEVEVSKYEPDIQYVDIYVPRPIAIPIKATGEYEQFETPSKKVSQEEFQYSMEGINPHLREIENYNMANENIFKKYMENAQEIAAAHHFEPPEPMFYNNTPSIENEPANTSMEYSASEEKMEDTFEYKQEAAAEEDEDENQQYEDYEEQDEEEQEQVEDEEEMEEEDDDQEEQQTQAAEQSAEAEANSSEATENQGESAKAQAETA